MQKTSLHENVCGIFFLCHRMTDLVEHVNTDNCARRLGDKLQQLRQSTEIEFMIEI